MSGETNLEKLLRTMEPQLNAGEYVFCTIKDSNNVSLVDCILTFREAEGLTLVMEKGRADKLQLKYTFVAAWITLTVHSSLEAVGLTAAFSSALAAVGISCNVVAGYYHDHLFVDKKDAARAMEVLRDFAGAGS